MERRWKLATMKPFLSWSQFVLHLQLSIFYYFCLLRTVVSWKKLFVVFLSICCVVRCMMILCSLLVSLMKSGVTPFYVKKHLPVNADDVDVRKDPRPRSPIGTRAAQFSGHPSSGVIREWERRGWVCKAASRQLSRPSTAAANRMCGRERVPFALARECDLRGAGACEGWAKMGPLLALMRSSK
jgi:hypothetical protein